MLTRDLGEVLSTILATKRAILARIRSGMEGYVGVIIMDENYG